MERKETRLQGYGAADFSMLLMLGHQNNQNKNYQQAYKKEYAPGNNIWNSGY